MEKKPALKSEEPVAVDATREIELVLFSIVFWRFILFDLSL